MFKRQNNFVVFDKKDKTFAFQNHLDVINFKSYGCVPSRKKKSKENNCWYFIIVNDVLTFLATHKYETFTSLFIHSYIPLWQNSFCEVSICRIILSLKQLFCVYCPGCSSGIAIHYSSRMANNCAQDYTGSGDWLTEMAETKYINRIAQRRKIFIKAVKNR